jgi:hypothetical protein
MIIVNQGLSPREKLLIVLLLLILIFAGYVWYDWGNVNNSEARYQRDSSYCEQDYDCTVVYDLTMERCITVNGLKKDEYEYDNSCRGKQSVCISSKCVLQ